MAKKQPLIKRLSKVDIEDAKAALAMQADDKVALAQLKEIVSEHLPDVDIVNMDLHSALDNFDSQRKSKVVKQPTKASDLSADIDQLSQLLAGAKDKFSKPAKKDEKVSTTAKKTKSSGHNSSAKQKATKTKTKRKTTKKSGGKK